MEEKCIAFWHRRDLRLTDNHGLYQALKSDYKVIPVFIFDRNILDKLEMPKDARVQFIHQEILKIKEELRQFGSDMVIRYGYPEEVWRELIEEYPIGAVYTNRDYEPYARERDESVSSLLQKNGVDFKDFKDHVIFEKGEVLKDDGDPYVVYSPYSRKWLDLFEDGMDKPFPSEEFFDGYHQFRTTDPPSLEEMGFESFEFEYPDRQINERVIENYANKRDIPSVKGTSRLSMHLRFGTISIRQVTRVARRKSEAWLNELIWRNFYQIIIWYFPQVVNKSFKPAYDKIPWRNNEGEFNAWCEGRTGYPIVDAGMRELNETGFMHNRVRMITASFLTKHLLVDWRWGEAYFARKLLDYELASNNGGWQWAAGSGCDAAPYFRVFNPELQTKKFDPDRLYIKKWVPEYGSDRYPHPIVDHKEARKRAIDIYKAALSND